MGKSTRKRRAMDAETAEAIAVQGLAFLAEEPARMRRFFSATGLDPDEVRARAASRELMAAVLEHLAGDESLPLVFSASRQVAAESIGPAIALLQAPGP